MNYYGSFQEYKDIMRQEYDKKSQDFIKKINSKKRKHKHKKGKR